MTDSNALAPIRKAIRVEVTPERAFAVFTGGIGRWWPASYSLLPKGRQALVIEPGAGGRW
jgi:hypothetical protein